MTTMLPADSIWPSVNEYVYSHNSTNTLIELHKVKHTYHRDTEIALDCDTV